MTETEIQPPGIGSILVDEGFITLEQLSEALYLQESQTTYKRLGDILTGQGWLSPYELNQALALQKGYDFIELLDHPPDPDLIEKDDIQDYIQNKYLPWRMEDDTLWIATADYEPGDLQKFQSKYGDHARIVITSKFDIIWSLQSLRKDWLANNAINQMYEKYPEYSARRVITDPQILFFFLVGLGLFAVTLAWPTYTLIVANGFINGLFMIILLFRAFLTYIGSERSYFYEPDAEEIASLRDEDLPVYTLLVPLYKEAEILPFMAQALMELDYPDSKLDIKLILEEDDQETQRTARDLGLPAYFEIIEVPDSQPKTKPKACNYALQFARGDFVAIYDAEDQPEPDQLKKVLLRFDKGDSSLACVQCQLNYYNKDENWLTQMFTLEYSLWFDYYIPALEYLDLPIPLGGTSNHFRAEILREAYGWDPFNVTEDCDLGIRLNQLGFNVGSVESTTFEEANSKLRNWIKQRSRWLKGYAQTYLVHMRNPLEFFRKNGAWDWFGLQMFVGGNVFVSLMFPIYGAIFLIWLLTASPFIDSLFPSPVLQFSIFNLLFGVCFSIFSNMLSVLHRERYNLVLISLTTPIYWVLIAVGGIRGIWQLLTNPFFWEKTEHGISKGFGWDKDLNEQ